MPRRKEGARWIRGEKREPDGSMEGREWEGGEEIACEALRQSTTAAESLREGGRGGGGVLMTLFFCECFSLRAILCFFWCPVEAWRLSPALWQIVFARFPSSLLLIEINITDSYNWVNANIDQLLWKCRTRWTSNRRWYRRMIVLGYTVTVDPQSPTESTFSINFVWRDPGLKVPTECGESIPNIYLWLGKR